MRQGYPSDVSREQFEVVRNILSHFAKQHVCGNMAYTIFNKLAGSKSICSAQNSPLEHIFTTQCESTVENMKIQKLKFNLATQLSHNE